MVIRKFIIAFLIAFFLVFDLLAGDTTVSIFSPRLRTLKTSVGGDFMSPPVIRLGSDDKIIVNFDEIGEDRSYLSARLIHCNSDWQPSSLVESEYLSGFNTIDIEDYAYSVNTFVHYVNYQLEIPSEGFEPMVSGNYLLQVYDRDQPDETLLQTRFRVVEPIVGVSAAVTTRTDKGYNDRYQQLSVMVDGEQTDIGNPYQDVKVEILQNGREVTSRFLKAPLRVDGSRLIYEHSPELLFPALNEYRRFESTSTRFPGMRVDSTKFMGSNYHTWVYPDELRGEKNYEYDRTQHGRFMVKEYNSTDSDIGADYITVHFFLRSDRLTAFDLYVDGEMTMGKTGAFNRMEYNPSLGGYELQMPLKQGAYNYQYVAIPKGENRMPDPSIVEGDKYETENEYNIYVYLRKPGQRYDRLAGYATVYTR